MDYTVVVTNTGAVDYPATVPGAASITDDLGDVLDDATLVPGSVVASAGTASIGGSTLTWNGPLPSGSSMTIEYAVVVNDPVSGDGDVINTVTGPPESNCDTGIETGCRTTTPIADLTVVKSATPNAVAPGGIVTYAIEIENTGGFVYSDATGPARVTDSLADDGVLDLATYVANSESATVGSAFFDGSTLSWTGPDAV